MANWDIQCGRRLRTRRRELNISQQSLATGVDRRVTSISKYELGLATPSDAVRHAIACVLLCEVVDIWPAMDREYVMAIARTAA